MSMWPEFFRELTGVRAWPIRDSGFMPRDPKSLPHRRIQLVVGALLALLLYVQFALTGENEVVLSPRSPIVMAATVTHDPFEKLIQTNPLAALKDAREQHLQQVKDYRCTLVKQELLPSGMSEEQEIDVLFRAEPYSVLFHWRRNPGLAERVIYVKNRWIDEDADSPEEREQALCQPGAVARLLLKSIKQPIHGKLAKKTSRRFIDEFGFAKALGLLIKFCDIAQAKGDLKLEYCGETRFDGRPVWVVRRTLPYTGEHGFYPDRIAEVFVDKEYRVPVAVYCYGDDSKDPNSLIAKYEYRNIQLGVGLGEQHFDPQTYGM